MQRRSKSGSGTTTRTSSSKDGSTRSARSRSVTTINAEHAGHAENSMRAVQHKFTRSVRLQPDVRLKADATKDRRGRNEFAWNARTARPPDHRLVLGWPNHR